MDIESYYNLKVKYFVEAIGMVYCSKWKDFTNDLGVQVTEKLKFVTKDEWDELFKELKVSKIQHHKLDIAIASLNATGPANLIINKPLPLKSESTKKYTAASENVSEKPSSKNKCKAGNANIKDYYKVKPKQVIDMTLNQIENNVPKSNVVLALENSNVSWCILHKDQD